MRRINTLFLVALMGFASSTAQARETEHYYPVTDAAQSERGKEHLLPIPFFLKGQSHPAVKEVISHVNTDRSTRGAFRSDEASCWIAFLSAMRVLQDRAEMAGGNAIIDVVSTTRGKQTESASDFRCVAGATIVHVGLKGSIVKLEP